MELSIAGTQDSASSATGGEDQRSGTGDSMEGAKKVMQKVLVPDQQGETSC
jgi:hypothetical protein